MESFVGGKQRSEHELGSLPRVALVRQRDPDAVRTGLAAWARAPVDDLEQPTAGGLSSETYLFRVNGRALVARLAPEGTGLFPSYDLTAQGYVMELLAEHDIVPVPRIVAYVDDTEFLGTPFLVMERVEGRVPTDQPSYLSEGWVRDAPPDEQRRVQDTLFDVCASVHAADWAALGFGSLCRPGGPGIDSDVEYWTNYLDWAADGAALPELRAALAWCRTNLPSQHAPPSLCWGDVRVPNIVFDADCGAAAVLDWEMATIAPAELDIGWFLVIHAMSVDVVGADLPGFQPRAAALARYEARLGRALTDLRWYEIWAAFRSAAIMVRIAVMLRDAGLVDDLRMQERNPSMKRLHALLPA
jgi:aminoglycoside phosphotransferase (APT) family kinase protein